MKFKTTLMAVISMSSILTASVAIAKAPQGLSHIHGAAFSADGTQVILGTHEGIFSLSRSGDAERISDNRNDYMSFIPHPTLPGQYLGSGHPVNGGNLGMVESKDGGISWVKRSNGLNGPVDFHKMAISPSDNPIIVGDHGGLQVTSNGGERWEKAGKLPKNSYAFSLSKLSDTRIYAATDQGIQLSHDLGRNWQSTSNNPLPATAVAVTPEGQILAYIVGSGLVVSNEAGIEPSNIQWTTLFNGFGKHVPVSISWQAGKPEHLLIRDQANALWESTDQGKTWQYFLDDEPLNFSQTQGKALFNQFCVACHQKEGVGESYSQRMLTDANYISAPSLDYLEHAWHHTDEQLAETIKNGSPRTPNMPAWSSKLSDQQVNSVISYIKSLWTQRELDCQGPKHMSCM